jgi:putative Mn2+ efflux pump MntP
VNHGNRKTMATRMARKMMLTLSLVTAAIAVLVIGAFTYQYASLLTPLGFIASILWLLALIGVAWSVYAARLFSQLGPRLFGPRSRWASASLQPGASFVAITGALVGIGWMFYAQAQPQASVPQRAHWFGQILLLVLMAALILKFFVNMRRNVHNDTGTAVVENAGKRERLMSDISRLTDSPWLGQFPNGTTGNRLRASLNWLAEEMQNCVPERGFVLAEASVSHFLDEQRRLVTFIQDLGERSESSDVTLTEAERRVLEGISRSSRLGRKIAV